MKMKDFVRVNRKGIDAVIDAALRVRLGSIRRNDEERRLWIIEQRGALSLGKI